MSDPMARIVRTSWREFAIPNSPCYFPPVADLGTGNTQGGGWIERKATRINRPIIIEAITISAVIAAPQRRLGAFLAVLRHGLLLQGIPSGETPDTGLFQHHRRRRGIAFVLQGDNGLTRLDKFAPEGVVFVPSHDIAPYVPQVAACREENQSSRPPPRESRQGVDVRGANNWKATPTTRLFTQEPSAQSGVARHGQASAQGSRQQKRQEHNRAPAFFGLPSREREGSFVSRLLLTAIWPIPSRPPWRAGGCNRP